MYICVCIVVYVCRDVCVLVCSCYVCHTCGCHRIAYCTFFSVVGSGDSIQIIRRLCQELLPAEPSNCPRILLSGHITTACVSTQICKSVIY